MNLNILVGIALVMSFIGIYPLYKLLESYSEKLADKVLDKREKKEKTKATTKK